MNNDDNKNHARPNSSSKKEDIQKIIDEHITHLIEKEEQELLHAEMSHSVQNKATSLKQRCLQMIKFRLKKMKDAFANRDKS